MIIMTFIYSIIIIFVLLNIAFICFISSFFKKMGKFMRVNGIKHLSVYRYLKVRKSLAE